VFAFCGLVRLFVLALGTCEQFHVVSECIVV
jgi:hypothetical protein